MYIFCFVFRWQDLKPLYSSNQKTILVIVLKLAICPPNLSIVYPPTENNW